MVLHGDEWSEFIVNCVVLKKRGHYPKISMSNGVGLLCIAWTVHDK